MLDLSRVSAVRDRLMADLRVAAGWVGVITAIGNQFHLTGQMREIEMVAGGAILWLEHKLGGDPDTTTPPHPAAPPTKTVTRAQDTGAPVD